MPIARELRERCNELGIQFAAYANMHPSTIIECEPPVSISGMVHMSGSIGAYTYSRPDTTLQGVWGIGRYCSIGAGVQIGGGEHPTDWLSTHPFQYGQASVSRRWSQRKDFVYRNRPKPVMLGAIGNDVWFGTNAIVRRGVNIGDGAVIGAGAVVTKDVPPYAIVGGSPARVIRYRFPPETIERLRRVQWWNYTADSLLDVRFSNIDHALDDVEKFAESGKLEPIPTRIIRITAAGEVEALDRKPMSEAILGALMTW